MSSFTDRLSLKVNVKGLTGTGRSESKRVVIQVSLRRNLQAEIILRVSTRDRFRPECFRYSGRSGSISIIRHHLRLVLSTSLQHSLHLGGRGAAESARERAPEVVAEKRVENGIDGAVGVAEDRYQLVEGLQPARHVSLSVDVQHDDLVEPVRQPADHVHGDHRQYHARHPPSRLLLTCNRYNDR